MMSLYDRLSQELLVYLSGRMGDFNDKVAAGSMNLRPIES